jgi:hypothetical protein
VAKAVAFVRASGNCDTHFVCLLHKIAGIRVGIGIVTGVVTEDLMSEVASLTNYDMTITENARPLSFEIHSNNETRNETVQFLSYPHCSPAENLFRIAKGVSQSLEESYDRLGNTNFKIASRLWVCSVSDHFAALENQKSDSLNTIECYEYSAD